MPPRESSIELGRARPHGRKGMGVRRVEDEKPAARIAIVQAKAIPNGDAYGSIRALACLGSEVDLEVVNDADSCIRLCRQQSVDLVVAEYEAGLHCERVLSALRSEGPPVVVTNRSDDPEIALEVFRRGAADCVALRSETAEALAVVALEQIRRSRAAEERGVAERRIWDLEQYNESIIQNMNSALLVVDLHGRITSCNPPAERIMGDRIEALRGRPVWSWFADGLRGGVPLARTLTEGARFRGAESSIRRADGTVVSIGISCAPFFDATGEKLGAVAIFQDLTEVKELQSQVLQAEKMASVGQLAAGIAHEINNPMGFIHANLFQMTEYLADLRCVWQSVEALQRVIADGRLEEVQQASEQLAAVSREVDVAFLLSDLGKALRESQEGSERIRHIVRDLRDFSHHDTGEHTLTDVNECLDSTATIVWPMMKHIVVLDKEYEELRRVPAYPMQIKQVFMNLLVNAYQSIEERVGESGDTGKIWLRTLQRGDGVVIQVSDTGLGIPEEHLDRIFDPFFTTKKVGLGTGLGLSTSYSIVKRHGGIITVDSKVGHGSTFSVFLPVDGAGEAAAEA